MNLSDILSESASISEIPPLRVLLVHNDCATPGSQETAVRSIRRLLTDNGHDVATLLRHNPQTRFKLLTRARSFVSGVHNPSSVRTIRRILKRFRPHVAHIHNIFPLLSPSILPECRRQGVPVVMTVHNYRLICPNGLQMTQGQICHRCTNGHEYQCILHNCQQDFLRSMSHTLRSFVARKRRAFLDNITLYIPLTHFQKDLLAEAGFPSQRMIVVPSLVTMKTTVPTKQQGEYVAFAGPISQKKGFDLLLMAAGLLPDIPFHVAGSMRDTQGALSHAPANITFRGLLNKKQMIDFYSRCRMLVQPSRWCETMGLCIVEAALMSKPSVCPQLGGLSEIVQDGLTGILFQPGNVNDLARKIQFLWEHPRISSRMGASACDHAKATYSPQQYYTRLSGVYKAAMLLGPGGPGISDLTEPDVDASLIIQDTSSTTIPLQESERSLKEGF